MPKVEELNEEEHGGGNQAPPLVFLHGAGGNRLHWPPGIRRLEGVHTYALDLPGHGRSPSAGEATIKDFARRVAPWRGARGVARPVLVGHSMGSAIALTVALGEPQSLARLILIGAGPRLGEAAVPAGGTCSTGACRRVMPLTRPIAWRRGGCRRGSSSGPRIE